MVQIELLKQLGFIPTKRTHSHDPQTYWKHKAMDSLLIPQSELTTQSIIDVVVKHARTQGKHEVQTAIKHNLGLK
jgi:hypothetical protein